MTCTHHDSIVQKSFTGARIRERFHGKSGILVGPLKMERIFGRIKNHEQSQRGKNAQGIIQEKVGMSACLKQGAHTWEDKTRINVYLTL